MEVMLALLLSVGIVIMVVLIFVGYQLYVNEKNKGSVNAVIASREGDLIDLYCSLEQIMNEIEIYTQQAKMEIEAEKEEIKTLHSEISMIMQGEYNQITQQEPYDEKMIPLENKCITKQENQLKEYEKSLDLKENKISSYFRKGLSVAEIAKTMDIGKGEVQLILNLKKNNSVKKMV